MQKKYFILEQLGTVSLVSVTLADSGLITGAYYFKNWAAALVAIFLTLMLVAYFMHLKKMGCGQKKLEPNVFDMPVNYTKLIEKIGQKAELWQIDENTAYATFKKKD